MRGLPLLPPPLSIAGGAEAIRPPEDGSSLAAKNMFVDITSCVHRSVSRPLSACPSSSSVQEKRCGILRAVGERGSRKRRGGGGSHVLHALAIRSTIIDRAFPRRRINHLFHREGGGMGWTCVCVCVALLCERGLLYLLLGHDLPRCRIVAGKNSE